MISINRETQHILTFVEQSITNFPVEHQLPIIQELFQTAIDSYTFARELEWYFYASIKRKDLIYGSSHINKLELLEAVNWALIAHYYMTLFKQNPDLQFSESLSSYHNKKYLKDAVMHDSGRYVFTLPKFARTEYVITLKSPTKLRGY
jgi:hypothetical protein